MNKGAIIDETGKYRYLLWRIWDKSLKTAVFVMLNPSTADAEVDDPTIRRCIGFAKSWGYGGIYVVNLYAYRTSSPAELKKAGYPLGPLNDTYLKEAFKDSAIIIAAWGTHGKLGENVKHILSDYLVHCIEQTKKGYPKHPLYIKGDAKPMVYCDRGDYL